MTWTRRILGVVAGVVGFAVGFYAGFFVLLSIVDLNEFRGWQFQVATLPTAGLGAGLAVAGVAPSTGRVWAPVVGAALLAALAVVAAMRIAGGDFGIAFGVGGVLVVAASAVAADVSTAATGE